LLIKNERRGDRMKKRILWLGLSFLVVAALVLASCAKEEVVTPGEQEEEEEEVVTPGEEEEEEVVTPAAGEPVYGGTLTMPLPRVSQTDPPSPDLMDGGRNQIDYLQLILENPLIGDFVNRGPRGTNEFPFLMHPITPEEFRTGGLLESWELTEEKAVWHVRPGIYWQGRDVMESRELTADDFVAWLLYYRSTPPEAVFKGMTTDKIIATDRYTLEIPFSNGYNSQLMYLAGIEDRSQVFPPEILGNDSWEDQVGTGPFMLKEYVRGSYMSFDRNPIWWQTETINGKEYEVPFIDTVICPIIPDMDTQVAALRTGKFDFMDQLSVTYWESLDATTPQLESRRVVSTAGTQVSLRTDLAPFNNVEVRKALMIGTDMKAFQATVRVGAGVQIPANPWPFYAEDPSFYVPLAEKPEEIQLLYRYNTTLAKQMLAAEGIPTGFKIVIQVLAGDQTIPSLLKDQWSKIGIDVQIETLDYNTLWMIAGKEWQKTYKGATFTGHEQSDPIVMLSSELRTGSNLNRPMYSNPTVDALIAQMTSSRDRLEQKRLAKEAFAIIEPEVPVIPLMSGVMGHFWWPWLKNYYGEVNVGDWGNPIPVLARAWIDQDLKAEMGFK